MTRGLCFLAMFAASGLCAPPAHAQTQRAFPAERMFDETGTIWSMSAVRFEQRFARYGYRWVSQTEKDTARAYRTPITFVGAPVVESLVRFANAKPEEATFILYSRGDSGDIDRTTFEALLGSVQKSLTAWTKSSPTRLRLPSPSQGIKLDARVWSQGAHQIKLEWSYSTGRRSGAQDIRPEYVRVFVRSANSRYNYRSTIHTSQAKQGSLVSRSALKRKVRKESDGTIHVNGVPMVDQGQKGYCVVAAAERVMRHFGRGVDQHEFAQLAQSSASRGTNPDIMMDVLRKLGIELDCKVTEHEDFDIKALTSLVKKYNRAAKKNDLREIHLAGMIDLALLYQYMDTSTLKTARMSSATNYKSFNATVKSYVDRGIPLLWSVMLGKVDETPALPQMGGGHMRLITGYNAKTKSIVYSDSWGAGHEAKTMSADDAWTITMALATIEPRRMSL